MDSELTETEDRKMETGTDAEFWIPDLYILI